LRSERYQIRLRNSPARKNWEQLEHDIPEAMERCKAFLRETPGDRLKARGKLKKLRGKLKGILQYDITDEARVHYRIDQKARVVYVEYVGHHP